MFYRCFLETVERWPDSPATEIQRQPGATTAPSELYSVSTTADGHVIESFSFRQMRRYADGVGHWLRASQVADARCAILAMNHPAWVATFMGIIGSGNTAVPLDTAFTAHQVGKLLDDCGASLLFTDERCLTVAQEAAATRGIRLVAMHSELPGLPCTRQMALDAPADFVAADVKNDDVISLIYTSGTTSDPKGVMLTDGNLVAELETARKFVHLGPEDCILGVLPLFHVLAQMVNVFFPLGNGVRVVFLDSLNTQELMIGLRERGVTIFCCVPQFFYLIHERIFGEVSKKGRLAEKILRLLLKLSLFTQKFGFNLGKIVFKKVHQQLGPNIRFFLTGGSRFDAQIGRDIQGLGFDMMQAYGLTETTSGCFCTPQNDNVIGSIGRPLPGLKARIVDPKLDENGHLVGEIAFAGPTVMKGYYNRPQATAEVLRDGWFYTGDLAWEDAKGNYFITGRAKDVIVLSSGKNIYPEEIESYYLRSSWIKEICVLGLESQKPGEPLSERLHGVIVPNFDVLREHKIANIREVIRYDVEGISATLPATKRILSYDIWQDDLPRTTTRKLRRGEIEKKLKALHAAGKVEEITPKARVFTAADREWLAIPEVARALTVVADAVGKDYKKELHPDDNLELDLGLDSMERVELLTDLAHHLGAEVADSAASEVYTVRELIDLVRANSGKATRNAPGWHTVFESETTDPEVLAITNPRPVVAFFWWLFGKSVKYLSHVLFRLRVEGMENLPEGAFVMCPNHASYLDAPILTAALPWRVFHNVFYVGTTEIFGSGAMRKLAQFLHLIPVDPDSNLVPAMRAGAYGLRAGKVLVMYPEGERSIEGPPKKFKKGAAILAQHLNVPIVPVAEYGFHKAWPRGKGFQGFAPLRIRVGKPIYPNLDEKPEHAYERLTDELRARVVEMWDNLDQDGKPKSQKPEMTHA
ncbi:MAG: AMP-binding protein [Acidobacteriota bacterium]|nr:AMP-binding protein [Acidobacteriota bacterium]